MEGEESERRETREEKGSWSIEKLGVHFLAREFAWPSGRGPKIGISIPRSRAEDATVPRDGGRLRRSFRSSRLRTKEWKRMERDGKGWQEKDRKEGLENEEKREEEEEEVEKKMKKKKKKKKEREDNGGARSTENGGDWLLTHDSNDTRTYKSRCAPSSVRSSPYITMSYGCKPFKHRITRFTYCL